MKTCLIVDDSRVVRKVASRIVRDLGFTVTEASEGAEALKMCREAMPDAVRHLMFISPLYYYMDASYGILLKGAGLDVLWPSVLGIVVLGSIFGGFGLWRFRRQFD